jgi:hypothetical protein
VLCFQQVNIHMSFLAYTQNPLFLWSHSPLVCASFFSFILYLNPGWKCGFMLFLFCTFILRLSALKPLAQSHSKAALTSSNHSFLIDRFIEH